MGPLTLFAPAKINPVLEVLGKRPDGYHELSLIFQTIGLYDFLTFEASGEGIRLEIPGAPPELANDEGNLVLKAARLFQKKYPAPERGARITLEKKIPIAAGLGGGSSDAAATLLGLDALFRTRLGMKALQEMAAELGSDVPFFLHGGTALGEGRGENITPLAAAPELHLVLVKPPKGLSTPAVYQSGKARFTNGEMTKRFLGLVGERNPAYLTGSLYNGLEPATFFLMPEVETIKRQLLEAGALAALVSGSGPTVFGIAPSEGQAREIAAKMGKNGNPVWVTKTVPAKT
ncbi:MAG TPA: 4-(cytidine 5'-diphospho)-2-C-methyl-D-erythritol kinase [bacterium]|nr:4-(cytidine 5'-diphospho)-2-C-methyl-D-erythritol kinase [bacterium]